MTYSESNSCTLFPGGFECRNIPPVCEHLRDFQARKLLRKNIPLCFRQETGQAIRGGMRDSDRIKSSLSISRVATAPANGPARPVPTHVVQAPRDVKEAAIWGKTRPPLLLRRVVPDFQISGKTISKEFLNGATLLGRVGGSGEFGQAASLHSGTLLSCIKDSRVYAWAT